MNKKITIFLSGIILIGITVLTLVFLSNNSLNKTLITNQQENTTAESKDGNIINQALTKIFEQNIEPQEEIVSEISKQVNEIINETNQKSKDSEEINEDNKSLQTNTKEKNEDSENIEKTDTEEIKNTEKQEDFSEQETLVEENSTEKATKEIDTEKIDLTKASETSDEEIDIKNIKNENTDEELIPGIVDITSIIASTNSININFKQSINTNKYICKYGTSKENLNNEGIIIENLIGYQCSINNLNEGQTYYFQIISINKQIENKTDIQSIKTNYKTPSKPKLINNIVTNNNIKVSFNTSKNTQRYSCLYKKSTEENWSISGNVVLDKNNVYCEINNLKENTDYEIKLIAINGDEKNESDIIKIKTNYIKPEIPVIKKITTNKNSINLILDQSKNATAYICKYGTSKNNLNNIGVSTIENGIVNCSLKGLKANTNYYVQIYTYNHDIYEMSDVIEVTTDKLAELSTPILTKTTTNSSEINAIFNIYIGTPKEFKCYYGESEDNLNMEGEVISTTNSSATCKIKNLQEGKKYYITLSISNDDYTKISEIYTVKTDYNAPTKSDLNNSNSTTNSIDAYFTKANNVEESICYYGINESSLTLTSKTQEVNKLIKCSLTNLNEGTDYYVKLVNKNGDKEISSDIYKITTEFNKPTLPELVSKTVTTNTIKLVFKKSDNATSYAGYMGLNKNTFVNIETKQVNDTVEISANNLKENTTYYLKLLASNNKSKTSSDIVEIKTNDIKITKPILSSSIHTDSSIKAIYNAQDNLDLYVCYYGTDKNNLNNSINAVKTDSNTRQCIINNLNENTNYFIKMSVIKNGNIIESNINEIKTDYKVPTIPTFINKESTNNSLNVSFNVDNNTTDYICKIGTSADNVNTIINAERNNNTVNCSANNLLSKSTYYVKLIAINGTNNIESDIIDVTTTYSIPTKPIYLSETKTDNSIIAYYSLSENTTDYICYIGTDFNNMTTIGDVKIENSKLKCTFNNLNSNTQYLYKVSATNHNEIFTNSDIKLSVTEYSTPSIPVVNNIYSNDNSFTLTYPLSTNAGTYTCRYGTDANNLNETGIITVGLGNTVSCSANNLNNNTTYYVKLTASNNKKYSDSEITKVTTKSIKTENNLAKPEYLGTGKSFNGYLTIKFSEVANAESQYCYYGTDKNNVNNKIKATYLDGYMKCDMPYDEANTYYVKSRAYTKNESSYSESDISVIKSNAYIPETPVLTSTTKDFENIITTYNTGGYSQGYKCYIGISENSQPTEGQSAQFSYKQYCAFTNLQPDTTYYIRIDNLYGSTKTSTITKVTTDKLNGCMGNGPAINMSNYQNYTVRVNSTCGVSQDSIYAQNAENVAHELASVDALKVLKDYPNLNVKSFASANAIYNPDLTISGFDIDTVLYTPGDISMVVGEYMLRGNRRAWIRDLP